MKVHVLSIDMQNSFTSPAGSLSVKGADKDVDRLALMIKRCKGKIDDIHQTLDQHHKLSIFHKLWFVNSSGKHPSPFTSISVEDIESGKWAPTIPSLYKRTLDYVKALRTGGKYDLTIWEDHCIIGSEGANISPTLLDALLEWEESPGIVDMVTKGSNPFTENYSALEAEVPDPTDTTTQLNTSLIKTLEEADVVAIAGEALSHCVKSTVESIVNNFSDPSYIKKFVLLTDCTSSVTGFEKQGDDFVKAMSARGMKFSTSKDFLS